ncbi:MAG: hypothetical protein IKC32_03655 [Clostridia bacterium]|nr:hypothetical protein [Clostridia bacterium]
MRFSVGYSTGCSPSFVDEIIKRRESIYEVYFSWGNFPSGRNDQTRAAGLTPWEAQARQIRDVSKIAEAGIGLNLLFNAACYGERAQSRALFNEVGDTVDYLLAYNLKSVTTTSPLIAKFIKQNFKDVELRASVNMGIGSILAMEYVAEYFDSFYVKRELNRQLGALVRLREWCDGCGKEMYILANSGCLNDCSLHSFHDNLVAHETGIAGMDNAYAFESSCSKYLSRPDGAHRLLDATSYIRPEDVHLFEGLVPAMKLATRVHRSPEAVLRAYIDRARYVGNIADLLEPTHTAAIYPYVVENSRITSEMAGGVLSYTNENQAIIRLEEDYAYQQNDQGSGL